jgi:hypothetical protein
MHNFSKDNLPELRKDINEALKAIAEKHNISIALSKCSFTSECAEFKLNASIITEDGVMTKEASDFLRCAFKYGLDDSDLFKVFKGIDGKDYKLVGANINARKAPLVIQDIVTGKEYKAPKDFIRPYTKEEIAA